MHLGDVPTASYQLCLNFRGAYHEPECSKYPEYEHLLSASLGVVRQHIEQPVATLVVHSAIFMMPECFRKGRQRGVRILLGSFLGCRVDR